jgi:prepilin-type N-terminal cleavage/methylation domain-containing protein
MITIGGYVFHKKLKQRGDTMIEVLLAMAVVGLSLGIAYGIANRAIATGRNAQERTEATKLAESQIEVLKSTTVTSNLPTNIDTEAYCILPGKGWVKVVPDAPALPTDPTPVPECTGVNDGLYDAQVVYIQGTASTPEVYRSIVTWEVPGSTVAGRVEISYRP